MRGFKMCKCMYATETQEDTITALLVARTGDLSESLLYLFEYNKMTNAINKK